MVRHGDPMRIAGFLMLLVACSACDAPHRHFARAEPVQVKVGENLFAVRRVGWLAEAIRLTPTYAPRLGPIGLEGQVAISRATGCRVVDLRGDAARLLGRLDC